MTETTQDGTDVVERLRALARHEHSDLSIGHEAADIIDVHRKTIEIANAGWNKDHSELSRLRTENEAMRDALTRIERCARVNFGHQTEKLGDIAPMAREALSHGGNDNVG